MATRLYGQFLASALNKEIDWDSDDIRVMLVSSAYAPNQDAHRYLSDVTGEVTGAGYTAGGAALTGKTLTYDPATNVIMLDANDVNFASSTVTARYAVVYDNTGGGTAATKPLISYVDFVSDQSSTNGNFAVTWDATGIARITVA